MVAVVLTGWAGAALLMTGLWVRQLRTQDASSVDAAWAATLGVLAVAYAATVSGAPARRVLVAVLAAGWAFRLAWHLWADRVRRHAEEDGRYAALRASWGAGAPWKFFVLYQAQAAAAVLFSLPFLGAMGDGPLGPLAAAGAGVWLVAVAGEAVADRQLARFRADPASRGRVCRDGLWRWSRHPNYFFEWLHWWTYVLVGGGAPLTWIGPVGMFAFLWRFTGIPHTERQALRSRGEAYRAYQRTTSAFFPWPPRTGG